MANPTATEFKTVFTAFAGIPTPTVDFWISLGAKLTSLDRWGDVWSYGVMLFAAHNLGMEANAASGGAAGGAGAIVGPLTSASVDKVSYSRDGGSAMLPDAGHWNLTTYGLRYIQLAKMFGAGPVQVGVPLGADLEAAQYAGGWPGVIFPQSTP